MSNHQVYSPQELPDSIAVIDELIGSRGGEKRIFDWWDDGEQYPAEYFWSQYQSVIAQVKKELGEPVYNGNGLRRSCSDESLHPILRLHGGDSACIWKRDELAVIVKATYHDAGTLRFIWLVVLTTGKT